MDYIEIKEENIILYGTTHKPLAKHKYIVYFNQADSQKHIHVNTSYNELEKGIYQCYIYYDRRLCNTIEELRCMTIDSIENQAYGSWMDGAR